MRRFTAMFAILFLALLLSSCSRYRAVPVNSDHEESPAPEETKITATEDPATPSVQPAIITPESTPPENTPFITEKPGFEDNAVLSEDGKTITVHNAEELIYHMESGKHYLLLPEGSYDLNRALAALTPQTGNFSLSNLEDVVIEGVGDKQVDFLTENYYENVIYLFNCKNITLKNLNIGHNPLVVDDFCAGAVVGFESCVNLVFDNCTMFGCGTVGIFGGDTSGLTCRGCTIRDCTQNVMELDNIDKAVFSNCDFKSKIEENIVINGKSDITIKNSRICGTVSNYPQILHNSVAVLDTPNDGKEHVIDNLESGGLILDHITIVGLELIDGLESLHEGLDAAVYIGRDEMSGALTTSCALEYQSALDDSEYLPQIRKAAEMVSNSVTGVQDIHIELRWPGIEQSIIYGYDGTIWLWNNYKDIGSVMNDQRDYLTYDEAATRLKEWFPPLMRYTDGSIVEETAVTELNNTVISGNDVFYEINISSGQSGYMETFNVKAVDGSISVYFDGDGYASVSYASQEQVNAVMDYLEKTGRTFSKEDTFRAYIVQGSYAVLNGAKYRLTDEDGVLKADYYEEWTGD